MSRGAVLIGLVSVLSSGCGPKSPLWMTDRAHKNCLNVIQLQVGRSTSDPSFLWNRYPQKRGELRRLTNGNDEYQYLWENRKCIVFWEANLRSEKVVGVRFEGTPDSCYLVP
jgi:hypothetical protein